MLKSLPLKFFIVSYLLYVFFLVAAAAILAVTSCKCSRSKFIGNNSQKHGTCESETLESSYGVDCWCIVTSLDKVMSKLTYLQY